jgi:hypothetical protein
MKTAAETIWARHQGDGKIKTNERNKNRWPKLTNSARVEIDAGRGLPRTKKITEKKGLGLYRLRRQTKILSGIQESLGGSKNQSKQLLSASTRAWTGALGSGKIQSRKTDQRAQIQLNQHNMVRTQHTWEQK